MRHVGCTLFSKALFYPMFSRFSSVVAGEVRLPSSQNKDHQIPDDHMGVLRHDSSIPTRLLRQEEKVDWNRI